MFKIFTSLKNISEKIMSITLRPEDLFHANDLFCFIINENACIEYINDFTLSELSFKKDDVLSRNIFTNLLSSYNKKEEWLFEKLSLDSCLWLDITAANGKVKKIYFSVNVTSDDKKLYVLTSKPENSLGFEIFNSLKEGIIIANKEAFIIACNNEACRILGVSDEKFINKRLWDVFKTKDDANLNKLVAGVFETGEPINLDLEVNDVFVYLSAFLYKDRMGKVLGVVISLWDASEFKKLEDKLNSKERLDRAVFLDFPLTTLTWKYQDNDFVLTDYNRAANDFTQNKISDLIGIKVSELFINNREGIDAINETYFSGETKSFESHYRLKTTGEYKYLLVTTFKLNGYGVQLYAEDITKRKETEEKLLKSEAFYRAIVEDQTEMIFRCDEKGVLGYVNEAFCRYFNLEKEEVIGKGFYSFIEKDSVNNDFNFEYLIEKNRTAIFEFEVVAGEETRWNQWIFRAIVDSENELLEYQAVGRDITDRKIFEEILKQKKAELEAIFSVFPDTFLRVDKELIVSDFLGKEGILGLSSDDIYGRSLNDAMPDILSFQVEVSVSSALREKSQENLEFWWGSTSNEDERYYEARFLPISEKDVVIVVRDITAKKMYEEEIKRARDELEIRVEERTRDLVNSKKKLEIEIAERIKMEEEKRSIQEQLFQVQKMEALGVFAGGIAHDFNNLMNIVNAYTQMLLWSFSEDKQEHSDLVEIQNAVNKASSLTHQLLIFSRQGTTEKHPVDLNGKIVEMVKMVNRIIDNDIKVEIFSDESIEKIYADPVNLEQVIMNLVVNARDAMPSGGKITIRTGKVNKDDNALTFEEDDNEEFVFFEISDTGTGMDKETLSRIFEPFFTTKARSKGTGLGLSVVYGIINEHKGYIKADSTLGKGTSFKVFLPVFSAAQSKSLAEKQEDMEDKGNGETILIVEDEPALLNVNSRALKSKGYKTLLASDASEARTLFRDNKESINMVFSDVMLPDGNGLLLVKEFIAEKGDLKVLLTSGYAGDKFNLDEVASLGIEHIQKPFKLPALFAKIREVLDKN